MCVIDVIEIDCDLSFLPLVEQPNSGRSRVGSGTGGRGRDGAVNPIIKMTAMVAVSRI